MVLRFVSRQKLNGRANKPAIVLTLLASTSLPILASYELLMFEGNSAIQRYDPQTGVSLGSFGFGQLGARGQAEVAINPTQRFQLDTLNSEGVIQKFNYMSGARLDFVTLNKSFDPNEPIRFKVLSNGNYLVNATESTGRTSKIYSPTGVLLTSMLPFGAQFKPLDSAIGSDGNIYTLNRIAVGNSYSFYTLIYNRDGGYLGFSTVTIGEFQINKFTSIGTAKNKILISGQSMQVYGGPQGVNIAYSTVPSYAFQEFAGVGSFAEGHERTYIPAWYNNAGVLASRLCYYNHGAGVMTAGAPIPPGTSNWIRSMAIVTAPEPTTLVAILGGIAAIVRRRNRKFEGP